VVLAGILLRPASDAGTMVQPVDHESLAPAVQALPQREVVRMRLARVNVRELEAATLGHPRALGRQPDVRLELFPGEFVVAVFDRFDLAPAGTTVWVGHVENEPESHVTLVYGDDLLTASIAARRGTYEIRPTGEEPGADPEGRTRVHAIREVDVSALPPEAEPIVPSLTAAELAAGAPTTDVPGAATIDVMVLYSPLARAYAGGTAAIEQRIALGVSETNASYLNSGVDQQVRLVHAAPVEFVESSLFSANLTALRSGTGSLNGVSALRSRYGADLVQLLVRPPSPDACGIAYVMTTVSTAFAPFGFSVVDAGCVSPNYTMAHEWGHNMGAQHDWFMSSATLPYTYAHGYVNPATGHRWRTVMAYNDLCSSQGFTCRRLLAWANASAFFNPFCADGGFACRTNLWFLPGEAMGVPPGTRATCRTGNAADTRCDADDRLALNNTGATVAAFSPTAVTTSSHGVGVRR
jgi:hypothetical protein